MRPFYARAPAVLTIAFLSVAHCLRALSTRVLPREESVQSSPSSRLPLYAASSTISGFFFGAWPGHTLRFWGCIATSISLGGSVRPISMGPR